MLDLTRDVTFQQLHDDPDDVEGLAKIESIRLSLVAGAVLPPLVGVRDELSAVPNVTLHDGRHRYNAYLRAGILRVPVWVAPIP